MSDEQQTQDTTTVTDAAPVVQPAKPETSPAEAQQTTGDDFPKSWDDVFKHKRFKELVAEKNSLAERLAAIDKAQKESEKAQKDKERKTAEEQGQYQKVAEGLKAELKAIQDELETSKITKIKAEEDAARERLNMLKIKAAAAVGLPVDFFDRLKGENEEEIMADAKKLIEAFPVKTTPNLNTDSKNGVGSKPIVMAKTDAEISEEAARLGVSFEHLKQYYEKLQLKPL
jgi:hypothetical protein